MMRHFSFLMLVAALPMLAGQATLAEVRIGKNVRIGGHDVSNQTFNKKRRGVYYVYDSEPKNPGCKWHKNADGSKTKVCHLKRKK